MPSILRAGQLLSPAVRVGRCVIPVALSAGLAAACGDSSPVASDSKAQLAVLRIASDGIPFEMVTGDSLRLYATDAAGRALQASWSSASPGVATVAQSGWVRAVSPGSAVIEASNGRARTTATVTVRAPNVPTTGAAPACSSFLARRSVPVSTASGLLAALKDAQPGDVIQLAAGTYAGYFTATASGTAGAPVVLCGPATATLQTGSITSGHALFLDGASHWIVSGITLTRSLGGLSIRGGRGNLVQWVEIHGVGQHGLHVATNSRANRMRHLWVHHTGLDKPEYGEGIYIGSWNGHWCARTGCQPDRTDSTQVVDSRFGPAITAEHLQANEGTTGGVIARNSFDGEGMNAPAAPWADSWVALMGNGYQVEDNHGIRSKSHGFEVWVELAGWGNGNVFRRNRADVRATGYGFNVSTTAAGNRVACDNTVVNAGAGVSTIPCS